MQDLILTVEEHFWSILQANAEYKIVSALYFQEFP